MIDRIRAAASTARSTQLRSPPLPSAERLEILRERLERRARVGQQVAQRRRRRGPRNPAERRTRNAAQVDDGFAQSAHAAIDLADDCRRPRFGVDVAHERLELARANGPAEKLLRDIRQLMRFVDDDDIGAG